MKNAIPIAIALVLAAGGSWYLMREPAVDGAPAGGGGARGPRDVPLVEAEPVRYGEVYDTIKALGTAAANESVTLTANVTDTVRRVHFEDGDFVEEGAVLVELTNAEEEALLAEARANLEDAQSRLARVEGLAERGLTSDSELDVARSTAAAAQARLDTVVARLSDRLIRAPFAGQLGFREVSPGTLVTQSTTVTTLDDISTIKLDFTVPETVLGALAPGAAIIARSASRPDHELEGTVRTIGTRVDPVTRAVTVRAHLPNSDRRLRPGMLLSVDIVTDRRRALVVSEHAVFQEQSTAYVYVVDDDNVAYERRIELGDRHFGYAEVVGGLEEGEVVVTSGIVKLRDGARVRFPDDSDEEGSSEDVGRSSGTSVGTGG